jgi:EAL domain-containing protein (putative c-di-GMP-specific phosphodiesterase class I)
MVNFSSIQFYEKSFALTIKEILTKFSLDPKFLIVKVTEDLLLDDSENIRNNLKELRSMGIKIALNDPNFSFIGLQNFNIDILILDGSFLNNVLTVTASASIVQSIIELTRQLNIKLVAVGIDNWEQKAFLEKLNCYAGQGDFYSKPLPKDESKTILKTGISDPEPLLPQNTYAPLVNERDELTKILFEIQTIVKRNTIFEDSSFTFDSPSVYFKGLANQ